MTLQQTSGRNLISMATLSAGFWRIRVRLAGTKVPITKRSLRKKKPALSLLGKTP